MQNPKLQPAGDLLIAAAAWSLFGDWLLLWWWSLAVIFTLPLPPPWLIDAVPVFTVAQHLLVARLVWLSLESPKRWQLTLAALPIGPPILIFISGRIDRRAYFLLPGLLLCRPYSAYIIEGLNQLALAWNAGGEFMFSILYGIATGLALVALVCVTGSVRIITGRRPGRFALVNLVLAGTFLILFTLTEVIAVGVADRRERQIAQELEAAGLRPIELPKAPELSCPDGPEPEFPAAVNAAERRALLAGQPQWVAAAEAMPNAVGAVPATLKLAVARQQVRNQQLLAALDAGKTAEGLKWYDRSDALIAFLFRRPVSLSCGAAIKMERSRLETLLARRRELPDAEVAKRLARSILNPAQNQLPADLIRGDYTFFTGIINDVLDGNFTLDDGKNTGRMISLRRNRYCCGTYYWMLMLDRHQTIRTRLLPAWRGEAIPPEPRRSGWCSSMLLDDRIDQKWREATAWWRTQAQKFATVLSGDVSPAASESLIPTFPGAKRN